MINDLAEVWNEIIEMQEAYPVAFGFWTFLWLFIWSWVWTLGEFIASKIGLKRSSERLNNKNGRAGKKEFLK